MTACRKKRRRLKFPLDARYETAYIAQMPNDTTGNEPQGRPVEVPQKAGGGASQHPKGDCGADAEVPAAGSNRGAVSESAVTDSQRLDWLERNLLSISHDRATRSVDMSGRCVRGQLRNEARGVNAGPSHFRVNHRSIREAVDAAMQWPNDKQSA